MNTNYLTKGKTWVFLFLFLFFGVMGARAEIMLGDNLILTGFVRQSLAVHIAEMNPNNEATVGQEDNNWCNLSRTHFQAELTFKPNDVLKLYSKFRVIYDQTNSLDSNLSSYDAFPLNTPHYGTTLRAGNDDNIMADIAELYSDLDFGKLWLRLGKQQIVWGEMFGGRIMDIINPLDLSWHWRFEPEEFENIRIPQWSARAIYKIEQNTVSWLRDLSLEGFINPGDISPDIYPEQGSPWWYKTLPPSGVYNYNEKDRWGDVEYGFRLSSSIGPVFGTLDYLYLYSDTGIQEYAGGAFSPGPPPLPFQIDIKYPSMDVYGMTLNYAIDPPVNTVVTFEGTYTPDYPYQDINNVPNMWHIPINQAQEKDTWKYAIQLQRFTFVFPTPANAMNIRLQFSQTIVKDPDEIKVNAAPYDESLNKMERTQNQIGFLADQSFWYNQIVTTFKVLYDPDGSYYFNPGVAYRYGNHWVFDVYANILGGSERSAGRFGNFYWGDEIMTRIMYQF
jgi:hypothetical protein